MTNTMSVNQMLEQIRQSTAAKLAAAKEAAKLKLLQNDKFQEALVQQALREHTSEKLSELNNQCEAIVVNNPVHNKTLKQVRTWNPSRRYGFGNQFAALSGLLSGIQYSVTEHNAMMLAVTNLSSDLIERTLDALGQLPYYSTNHNTVVEGKPTNMAELLECVQLIELALDITIDKSNLTQAVADRQYEVALAKAGAALAEAELATTVDNFIIR